MIGPYTREKICNLNDDCNSSLECEFSRGGTNSYKHMLRKLRLPKDVLDIFAYTHKIHCDLSETSLEFTSGLEFEFVIVISIRVSNSRTHMLKKSSLELFFTGMIIQMTIFCPSVRLVL